MIKKFFYYHRKKNYSISISKDPIEDAKKCWLEAMLENELMQERDRNR